MGAKFCCTHSVHQPPPSKKNLLASQHESELRTASPKINITIVDNSVPEKPEADNGDDIPDELDTKVTDNNEEEHNTKVADDGDDIPEDFNTKVAEKCNDIPENLKTKAADNVENISENQDTNASDRDKNIRDVPSPESLNVPNAKTPEISKAEAGGRKPSGSEANMYMNELGDVFTSAGPLRSVTNTSLGLANSNSFSPEKEEVTSQQLRVDN